MDTVPDIVLVKLFGDACEMPINMSQVNARLRVQMPHCSLAERQQLAVDAIAALVSWGAVRAGHPGHGDIDFVAEPLEDALRHLRATYVDHYEDPSQWIWSCWLQVVEGGSAALDTALHRRHSARLSGIQPV